MIPDPILREMLGDDLHDALKAARDRLSDDTIMVRIGSPGGKTPGLVYVERAGKISAQDMGHEAALIYLGQMA